MGLVQLNPIYGVLLDQYNPILVFILGQLNPIHGVFLDQYNPILVFILGQLNPIHGVIIGFKEPNIGLGRTFPIWENPLKSQMIPINFPLLTQFGNFEKFPVCKTI